MKLYDLPPSPNARRVRIFIAEKGIEIPTVAVDMVGGENRTPEYLAKNSLGKMPVLELDDGTCIAESVAICRYLEELYPDLSLMGRDAKERAIIEMWNRRVELDGFVPAIHALRNADPLYEGRVLPGTRNDLAQVPEITERGKASLTILLERLDAQLADNPFLAGETFSIADITGYFTIGVASRIDFPVPDTCPNVARWYEDVAARPSTQA